MAEFSVTLFVFSLTVLSILVNRGVLEKNYLSFLDIPYYWSPLLGTFLLYFLGILDFNHLYQSLFGFELGEGSLMFSAGPFSTIILFLSVAFIALSLEVSGFFRFLSVEILEIVNGSGKKLFVVIFWVSGLLALFTSNDIVILTMTPFLLIFLDLIDVDAIPFLLAQFFAANIFSMIMLIGNETNIIASNFHNIGFVEHAFHLFLSGIVGGVTSFVLLYYLFRERIDLEYNVNDLPEVRLNRWEILSMSLVLGALLSFGVLSVRGFLLWHIGLIWVIITFFVFILPDLIENQRHNNKKISESFLYKINQKMPWEVVPFLLGFFMLVQALYVVGFTDVLAVQLTKLVGDSLVGSVFGIGILSTLATALLNNIPATVLISEVLANFGTSETQLAAVYSLIIGSNIGANLTPIGALAGIMWMKMLENEGINFSFVDFVKYGFLVTSITAITSLSALYLTIILT